MADPQYSPNKRPTFPFLKRGEGLRRFRMPPAKQMSTSCSAIGNEHLKPNERRAASASSSPCPQTQRRPTTATTQDSGLPDDQHPSTESLTQREEDDDVFVDDEVAVTMSSASSNQSNQNPATNESVLSFQPNFYSTPIAKDVDQCTARLNLFAPNSVKDALKLMEEVETASTGSDSLTSLQQIETPSVTENVVGNDESNAVAEEANRRPADSDEADSEKSKASATIPPPEQPSNQNQSFSMLRASNFEVSPQTVGYRKLETPLPPTYTSARISDPGIFSSIKRPEIKTKITRPHSADLTFTDSTPVKYVNFRPKPAITTVPKHDVSLLTTPIFPNYQAGSSFDMEAMAELMRHQMMSFDTVVDEIDKRYAKRDSIRESKLRQFEQYNKECQKQVEELKAKLRLSQGNEKGTKEEIARLKKQLEAAKSEIEEQKQKNAQVSKTLASTRLDCQNQKKELAKVTAEKNKLKEDLEKSNSLHGTLEMNLREERRMNHLLNQMSKQFENFAQERPKPVAPVPTNTRPNSSHGRKPFGPVGQIRGPLGSDSSTNSSNATNPVRQKHVVFADAGPVPFDDPLVSPNLDNDENENIEEGYLMEYVPKDAVMDTQNWDGQREVRTYTTSNMQYIWSWIAACGCETLLVNNHDYYQYCAFGTPVHIFMAPFTEANRAITITVANVRINSFSSKQLEIHRLDSSNKTIIKDSNERYEYLYSPESNTPVVEIFNGNAGRRKNRDGAVSEINGTGTTAVRADGSYCVFKNDMMTFKHQWFDLSRSTAEDFGGGFRIAVYESNSDRYLQLNVCPEHSVVIVKHVQKINGKDQKEVCTGHRNECEHLK